MIDGPVFPHTYEQWRRCITLRCRIPLIREYIEGRLRAREDAESAENSSFLRLYGNAHRDSVRSWFRQALRDLPISTN